MTLRSLLDLQIGVIKVKKSGFRINIVLYVKNYGESDFEVRLTLRSLHDPQIGVIKVKKSEFRINIVLYVKNYGESENRIAMPRKSLLDPQTRGQRLGEVKKCFCGFLLFRTRGFRIWGPSDPEVTP